MLSTIRTLMLALAPVMIVAGVSTTADAGEWHTRNGYRYYHDNGNWYWHNNGVWFRWGNNRWGTYDPWNRHRGHDHDGYRRGYSWRDRDWDRGRRRDWDRDRDWNRGRDWDRGRHGRHRDWDRGYRRGYRNRDGIGIYTPYGGIRLSD